MTPGGLKKPLLAGAAAVTLFTAAFSGWLLLREPSVAFTPPPEAGVADISRAVRAHPGYPALETMKKERREIMRELEKAMDDSPTFTAPEAFSEPFDDAAEQKRAQKMMRERKKSREALDALETERREATKAEFEAARGAIDDLYFNEIFNIQLKLDNSEVMKLSEDEVSKLKERLLHLRRERGRKQIALRREYDENIRIWRENAEKEERERLSALEERLAGELQAAELAKRSEASRRNVEAMREEIVKLAEARQRVKKRAGDLREMNQKISDEEEKLTRDIKKAAEVIAGRRHLPLIYAKDSYDSGDLGMWRTVLRISIPDVTDEIIAEIGGKR